VVTTRCCVAVNATPLVERYDRRLVAAQVVESLSRGCRHLHLWGSSAPTGDSAIREILDARGVAWVRQEARVTPVGTIWIQLITLLGVLLGALGSFVSTRYFERERRRHERSSRWDSRKLEAYAAFADATKDFIQIAQRVGANRGLGTAAPLPVKEGLEKFAEAESRMGVAWKTVLLLGNASTIVAARNWRHAAWHLEWFARNLRTDPTEYVEAARESGRARRAYYDLARRDLGISSEPLPELSWPPSWRKDEEKSSTESDPA
jgi:hypothetical protein